MKKLSESCQILMSFGGLVSIFMSACVEINYYRKDFQKHVVSFKQDITLDRIAIMGLTNQILIMACSFLDEWNKHLTPTQIPNYSDRILKLKTITKPITKRINQWKGLKEYRNVVLAHNFRIRGESAFTSPEKVNFNIPGTSKEILLLVELINALMVELQREFKQEFLDFDLKQVSKEELNINDPRTLDVNEEINKLYGLMGEEREKYS